MKTNEVQDEHEDYYNAVNIRTGEHELFANIDAVKRYIHEIEITYSADDIEDFI